MAFYKYFWDLENSQTYDTHTVGQFDNNATTGGGTFRWVGNVSNASIPNIAGMRIRPRNSTIGYWERVYDGPVNVGWFGCQNTTNSPLTFASMGISQATLDLRYGTGFTSTNDYYDSTAIRYAFKMMGTAAGYQSLIFDPKKYWIRFTCQLPVNLPGSSSAITEFIIDGNGATLVKAGTISFNFFERVPPTQSAAAATYINNSFIIKNFNVNGVGGPNWQSTGSFLFLGAATNCVIENINLSNFAYGIWFLGVVNSTIRNINTSNVKIMSIRMGSGGWTGALPSNSATDNVTLDNIKIVDTLNQNTCIEGVGNNLNFNKVSITGTGAPSAGIIIGGWQNLTNTSRITDIYFDILFARSGILLNLSPISGGRFIIDGVNNKQANTIIEVTGGSGEQPDVYIANLGTWVAGSKFSNSGTGFASTWDLYNVRFGPGITTAANVVNPANNLWVVGGIFNSNIPNVSNVRYVPPIVP
jgi:hypothetical protein